MTDADAFERATVIVDGSRIASVTPSSVPPARGMSLLPGLADVHAHYAEFGPLFLANGVTTVRHPGGQAFITGNALAKAGV